MGRDKDLMIVLPINFRLIATVLLKGTATLMISIINKNELYES